MTVIMNSSIHRQYSNESILIYWTRIELSFMPSLHCEALHWCIHHSQSTYNTIYLSYIFKLWIIKPMSTDEQMPMIQSKTQNERIKFQVPISFLTSCHSPVFSINVTTLWCRSMFIHFPCLNFNAVQTYPYYLWICVLSVLPIKHKKKTPEIYVSLLIRLVGWLVSWLVGCLKLFGCLMCSVCSVSLLLTSPALACKTFKSADRRAPPSPGGCVCGCWVLV